jgi:hypothetical protein
MTIRDPVRVAHPRQRLRVAGAQMQAYVRTRGQHGQVRLGGDVPETDHGDAQHPGSVSRRRRSGMLNR